MPTTTILPRSAPRRHAAARARRRRSTVGIVPGGPRKSIQRAVGVERARRARGARRWAAATASVGRPSQRGGSARDRRRRPTVRELAAARPARRAARGSRRRRARWCRRGRRSRSWRGPCRRSRPSASIEREVLARRGRLGELDVVDDLRARRPRAGGRATWACSERGNGQLPRRARRTWRRRSRRPRRRSATWVGRSWKRVATVASSAPATGPVNDAATARPTATTAASVTGSRRVRRNDRVMTSSGRGRGVRGRRGRSPRGRRGAGGP